MVLSNKISFEPKLTDMVCFGGLYSLHSRLSLEPRAY